MKKILYFALMTFVMIGVSACSKDKDLTGTKWVGQFTETDNGLTMTADVTVEFTTETAGKMTVMFVMTDELRELFAALGMTDEEIAEMMNADNSTVDFTYTYDGEGKGTMSSTDEDGETTSIDFTIDDDKMTITEEGYSVVLTKQK